MNKKKKFDIFLSSTKFKNKDYKDLDSVDILEFLVIFEKKFKLKINLDYLHKAKNWSFFIKYIK